MIEKTTAIILSGGKSSRMGRDKAFGEFSGKPLIETLINKLSRTFEDLMIITNKPEQYKRYSVETKIDIIKD